jgi:exodeoxyribonuclease V alpha subunit
MSKFPHQLGLTMPRAPAPEGILEGEVLRVTFESETTGFRVLKVECEGKSLPETVVGVFPPAPPGARIRATGKRITDSRHGEQFRAETLLTLAPSTLDGVCKYLGSGLVPGVGPAFAKRIVDVFGERTLDVLDREPERLHEVAGLGPSRVASIASAWSEHRDVGAIMVFLQSHGASPALATRIYKRLGRDAMNVVATSPYRLALDVWGIGFKTADQIARSVGVAADAPERLQAGIMHLLHEMARNGHVYAEREALVAAAGEMLGSDAVALEDALVRLRESGRLHQEALVGGDDAIYTPAMFHAEVRVSERFQTLLRDNKPLADCQRSMKEFEKRSGLQLAGLQRDAVRKAAERRVVVITGGPGTGKTTVVQAILALFDTARCKVALAAPTGRAAKRLSETTGREASTLHRLLEYEPKGDRFQRCRDNPLAFDAIVVDETSMVSLLLCEALLDAVDDRARLVLVGDVDQLPSVGPGAVLRDVIDSGCIPTVRLSEIFRQAEGSSIVTNAHRIHAGEMPVGSRRKDEQFYVIKRDTVDSALSGIDELVTQRIPRGFGLDPLRDIQVLTPMQRGPAGAIALNQRLQARLNPERPEALQVVKGQRILRLGDKVMQLRNDYDKEVFNGDVGRIVDVSPGDRKIGVRFDGRIVSYGEGSLDELSLAYATSIHKSQGSEYPAVVVPVLTQHFVMLCRNLLYTAVTRAKKLVVLVADPRAVSLALAQVRREERRSQLAARLIAALQRA